MKKKLEVKVKDKVLLIPYTKLHGIQGALKIMPDEHFRDIRESMLKDGIDFVLHVWKDKKGKIWIIDGHGRHAVVKHLAEEEKISVPDLPCVETVADTFEQAKLKVLRSSSNYNVVTKQGLYEFMSGAGITLEQLEHFHLPEISIPEFKMEFYSEPGDEIPDKEAKQSSVDEYQNAAIKQIVLYYSAKEYEKILGKLEKLLEKTKSEDYSQVVWKLVNEKV